MHIKLFKKSIFIFIAINIIICSYMLYRVLSEGKDSLDILLVLVQTILVLLSIFFGYYINRPLQANEDKYFWGKREETFKSILLNKSPIGFIVINVDGLIEYLNPAIGYILGSTRTVGLNILEFDTVRNSRLYEALLKAINGESVEIRGERYMTYITRQMKTLNFFVYPDCDFDSKKVSRVIIIVQDITEEVNLTHKLRVNYHSTIETLATLVDARDMYTGEHSKNVTIYALMICQALGLSEEETQKIRLAASFHDIGKIGVSDFILNKPARLTQEEYEKMKRHSNLGANILMKIEGFLEISEIVRHHHERWDGKGYPSGLAGEQIPFGARIIAVADAYDAMTSDRIYRSGMTDQKAIDIMLEERGKQLDPKIVNLFISELRKENKKSS